MTDKEILNEVTLNRRHVSHDVYGSFLIRRPSNRIQSYIDSARTRSINKDLQTEDVVEDPVSGEQKRVPAYLTKSSKRELLKRHGEWTREDELELEEAEREYSRVCTRLDRAGFTGFEDLVEDYKEVVDFIESKMGEEKEDLHEELKVVIPILDDLDKNDYDEFDLPEPEGDYSGAKSTLEKAVKDVQLASKLRQLDDLHKQYTLFLEGIEAQSKLYMIKIKEISLFSDTVESRADKAAQVCKVYHCTLDPDTEEQSWDSMDHVEDDDPDKISWLLEQIERFERIDPTADPEEEKKKYRFNFLFPLGGTVRQLGESHAQRKSSSDGELQEETP